MTEWALNQRVFLEQKEIGYEFELTVGALQRLTRFDADGQKDSNDDANEDDEDDDNGEHGFT